MTVQTGFHKGGRNKSLSLTRAVVTRASTVVGMCGWEMGMTWLKIKLYTPLHPIVRCVSDANKLKNNVEAIRNI